MNNRERSLVGVYERISFMTPHPSLVKNRSIVLSLFDHYLWSKQRKASRGILKRYGAAVILIAIITFLKLIFQPYIGSDTPFLLYFGAIILIAGYGGVGPAVFGTLASAAICAYYFLPSYYAFGLTERALAQLSVYIAESALIIILSRALSRAFETIKANEEQAREAAEASYRLAALVEFSDDAIIGKNLDNHITGWNLGAEKMYGFTKEEAIGQHISILVPDNRMNEVTTFIEQTRDGIPVKNYEGVRRRKDGSLIDVSITISPIKDEEGVIIGATTITHDITDRKILERQKDDFLGIASHELKTPVTSIKVYAQMLKQKFEEDGDAVAANQLGKIDTQLDRLTTLINGLLDVTKIESGNLPLSITHFAFDDLVTEVVDMMQFTTRTHLIVIDGKSNAFLNADRERIGQVLINLLSNAIKYSPKSSSVVVGTSATERELTFSISDSGIGIDALELTRIFERFYRSPLPTHETYPGMGLGLFISAEMIRRHNGQIKVQSEKGAGSTFTVTLPLDDSAPSSQ